jgi:hypothetical protein
MLISRDFGEFWILFLNHLNNNGVDIQDIVLQGRPNQQARDWLLE